MAVFTSAILPFFRSRRYCGGADVPLDQALTDPDGGFVLWLPAAAYTRFVSATCATLPQDLTACRIGKQPAVNTRGGIEWTFDGALAPDAKGTVVFSVTVE